MRPGMLSVELMLPLNWMIVPLISPVVGTPLVQLAAVFQVPPDAGPTQICVAGAMRCSSGSMTEQGMRRQLRMRSFNSIGQIAQYAPMGIFSTGGPGD